METAKDNSEERVRPEECRALLRELIEELRLLRAVMERLAARAEAQCAAA